MSAVEIMSTTHFHIAYYLQTDHALVSWTNKFYYLPGDNDANKKTIYNRI